MSLHHSSPVVLNVPAKGDECKSLMPPMIKFIDDSIKNLSDAYRYDEGPIFEEDQAHVYDTQRDLFLPIMASNPSNVYRVASHLFVVLVLPRTRNPVRNIIIQPAYKNGQGFASTSTAMAVEYGYADMQYGATQYACGRLKVASRAACECNHLCNRYNWADEKRVTNYFKYHHNKNEKVDEAEVRYHNSHRCISPNFKFWDSFQENVKTLCVKRKKLDKRKDLVIENITEKHDLLSMQEEAFDMMKDCYAIAGLHHVFCPDVIMMHRGNNFHINLQNNALDITNKYEGDEMISHQTMDNYAAINDITRTRIKSGRDVIDAVKKNGGYAISFRNYSESVSKLTSTFNRLTLSFCDICNQLFNHKEDHNQIKNFNGRIMKNVCSYIEKCAPLIETLLTIAHNDELKTAYDKYKRVILGNEEMMVNDVYENFIHLLAMLFEIDYEMSSESAAALKKLLVIFALFKVIAKFSLRNYNAAVCSAINRRGYLCHTSTITGYRFNSDGVTPSVRFHETIGTISSCLAYSDYFSFASSNNDGAYEGDNDEKNAMDSLFDDDFNETEARNRKTKTDQIGTFLQMFGYVLLGGDEEEEDKEKDEKMKKKKKKEEEEEEEEEEEAAMMDARVKNGGELENVEVEEKKRPLEEEDNEEANIDNTPPQKTKKVKDTTPRSDDDDDDDDAIEEF